MSVAALVIFAGLIVWRTAGLIDHYGADHRLSYKPGQPERVGERPARRTVAAGVEGGLQRPGEGVDIPGVNVVGGDDRSIMMSPTTQPVRYVDGHGVLPLTTWAVPYHW